MNDKHRRDLKQWERDLLWRKSRGRCLICNRKIIKRHADHIVPFVATGRTNVYEMQDLCADCNLRKGAMSMDEAILKLRKFDPDLRGYRADQRRLHAGTLRAVESGETEIGIHLHIRGGKSMLQRMISVHLAESSLCAVSLAINNRAELRRQIVDPARWLEDFDRLNTIAPRAPPYGLAHVKRKNNGDEVVGQWLDDPWPNDEYLLSTTIQTVCSRTEQVISWIQSVNHKTGLPVVVFLDECQNFGIDDGGVVEVESRNWYPTIKRLQAEAKIIIIALSGYPLREDGLCLPGFIKLGQTEEERERWVKTGVLKVIDERRSLVQKKLMRYIRQSFSMAPKGGIDFIVGMNRGFETSALCALHHWPISHKITYKEDNKILLNNQSLADVEETTARKVLGVYVWDDRVIAACVSKFVELLSQKSRTGKSFKGLIYAMADIAGRGEDAHAHKIAAELKRIAAHLRVRIITMNYAGSRSDALLAFVNDDCDVAILKFVGRVGFDCPRAKVLLDLSTVRTECMVAQTWLRVSTPCDGVLGDIITPSDITAVQFFQKIVTHNGGDIMSRTSDAEYIDEDEVIIEKKDRAITIGDQDAMGVITHQLREVPAEQCRLVDLYLAEHPGYNSLLQQHDMFDRLAFVELQIRDHGWTPPPDFAQAKSGPPQGRRYSEAHQYRGPINDAWNDATNFKLGVDSRYDLDDEEDKKRWNSEHRSLGREAKRLAGQPADRKLDQIQNLDALEIILSFFEEIGEKE
jgi:hypothetical protein